MSANLYDILGIPRNSTADEIKRQYRKLAIQCHPDKNPGGVELFKEITHAYRILIDPEQRKEYDSNKKKVSLSDLQVELTQEELRAFVEELLVGEKDEQNRRMEFERRKEEEARRRAEFEKAHPNFKMSSVSYRTVLDAVERDRERMRSPRVAEPSIAPNARILAQDLGVDLSQGASYKMQMLAEFRSTGKYVPTTPAAAPILPTTTEVVYEKVVLNGKVHGPRDPAQKKEVAEAILSDALRDYDNFRAAVSRYA